MSVVLMLHVQLVQLSPLFKHTQPSAATGPAKALTISQAPDAMLTKASGSAGALCLCPGSALLTRQSSADV